MKISDFKASLDISLGILLLRIHERNSIETIEKEKKWFRPWLFDSAKVALNKNSYESFSLFLFWIRTIIDQRFSTSYDWSERLWLKTSPSGRLSVSIKKSHFFHHRSTSASLLCEFEIVFEAFDISFKLNFNKKRQNKIFVNLSFLDFQFYTFDTHTQLLLIPLLIWQALLSILSFQPVVSCIFWLALFCFQHWL